jgi:hypothetical protein
MHDLRPEIDHLGGLWQRAEVADVLVQCDVIVLGARWTGFQRLGLDVVADAFEVLLFGGGEL